MGLSIDKIKPKPIKYVIIEEPPYDTKGRGSPTTGRSPITIDIFIIAAKKKLEIKPYARTLLKKSRLNLFAMLYVIEVITIINPTTESVPRKPNSSPNIEKIKSVCFSGKKSR